MPFELWGVTSAVGLSLPDRVSGFLLLSLYSALFVYAVFRYRNDYLQLSSRQWLLTIGLAIFSFLTSQLFPLRVSQTPVINLTLFAIFPFLLTGAILNPAAALVVGLMGGLGRALGQTHYLFDLFHFALAAVLAANLMQQNYLGRLFQWLRQPLISGAVSGLFIVVLAVLANFVSVNASDTYVMALDRALYAAKADFWSLLIEGALGGGIVTVILIGLPQLRLARPLVPSPLQLSLQNRLLSNFALFAVLLTFLLVTTVFSLSVSVSTRLVVNQMAHNTQTVFAQVPGFQSHLQQLLAQYDDDESLLKNSGAENAKVLRQLHRTDLFYRRMFLIDNAQTIMAVYPPQDLDLLSLSPLEEAAVAETFATNSPKVATADSTTNEHIVSFVVPVRDSQGMPGAALVGQVPQFPLESLIIGLQGTVGQGTGFIIDQNAKVIAHSDERRLLQRWKPAQNDPDLIRTPQTAPGVAYKGVVEQSGLRELVYYMTTDDPAWQVVTTVPYTVVLSLALSIGGPLAMVLLVVLAIFYANLAVMGRDITRPIKELVEAARTIAVGGRWSPSADARRNDEIGQLSRAFSRMHRSRNKRLRELSLLLDVSHNVASNIDISQGMPAILRGALRGTGAAGARAVVLNPNGSYPLAFGEGPASEDMAKLDRAIMTQARDVKEMMLATPEQIKSMLEVDEMELPVPAMVALPLHFQERFQGIMWLGYRQPHGFDPAAQTLLRTLAGQAAVLVENSRLFAVAEGGRRRLAAVLASTTDAVIVTDQTDRILLINRAMENAFSLKLNEVVGRPLADVIENSDLIEALTGQDERVRNLEIPNHERRIFYTSAAPIIKNDGQALGRVAVLHDITQLKEIDQMKSDFVSTVSHDLRGPLTYMRGYVTMLPMVGETNEKQEAYITKILGGIEHMAQLVNDLLDLGRIEAGVGLLMEDIEIEPLLSNIATDYWQHAHLKGIKLQVDISGEIPNVCGDLTLVRQALTNLVTNGIKYAPDSGLMILGAEFHNGEVVLSVKDNGPGIPQSAQMRLFEKFFRIENAGTKKEKGSGLGLAIVKSIAERHGGRVWCESQDGEGSTFFISLPLPEESPPAVETGATEEANGSA